MIRDRRGVFAGVGVITLAVILVVIGFSAALNSSCQSRFWDGVLVYPGAELVDKQSNFLGLQRVQYRSDDETDAINAWYNQQHGTEMRAAVTSGNVKNLPAPNWLIEPDTQRPGTLITIAGTCP